MKDDARERERAADDGGGQDARQPGDEEDLRVDVLGKRLRPIEDVGETDAGAADERRQQAGRDRQRAEGDAA